MAVDGAAVALVWGTDRNETRQERKEVQKKRRWSFVACGDFVMYRLWVVILVLVLDIRGGDWWRISPM